MKNFKLRINFLEKARKKTIAKEENKNEGKNEIR